VNCSMFFNIKKFEIVLCFRVNRNLRSRSTLTCNKIDYRNLQRIIELHYIELPLSFLTTLVNDDRGATVSINGYNGMGERMMVGR